MVKSLISIAIAMLLLAGAAVFEWIYIEDEFDDFQTELKTLYDKIDNETVSPEDAKIVQNSWERRKEGLYIWIPHSDISRIDDYVSQTVGFVNEKNYPLALANLEMVLHLTDCLPSTYRPTIENIL